MYTVEDITGTNVSQAEMGDLSYFPVEIVLNIFTRLDARDLIRCQMVSHALAVDP